MTEDPNVLLLVLDSVRARNLSLYGYSRETTPCLETISEGQKWVTYEEARSPGRESHTSHTSIFTGRSVHEHRTQPRTHSLKPGISVWERLHDEGYETGVFSKNVFITSDNFGLSRGFETIETLRDPPFESINEPRDFHTGVCLVQYLLSWRRAI